ncbi:hypothetical protein Tco_0053167 [Tanacetum coccineum]
MYRIKSRTTKNRALQLPQTYRNTNPYVSTSTGVTHRNNVSKPQTRNTQMKDKVLPNISQVKYKKTKVEDHHRISIISNQTKSVTACNDNLKSRTSNVNVVCATCGKYCTTLPITCRPLDVTQAHYGQSISVFDADTENQRRQFANDTSGLDPQSQKAQIMTNPDPAPTCKMFLLLADITVHHNRNHPLLKVHGNPSKPVQIRRQLATDPEMCMFALTVSIAEPNNIKEAMANHAWTEAMQEELHQFDRTTSQGNSLTTNLFG